MEAPENTPAPTLTFYVLDSRFAITKAELFINDTPQGLLKVGQNSTYNLPEGTVELRAFVKSGNGALLSRKYTHTITLNNVQPGNHFTFFIIPGLIELTGITGDEEEIRAFFHNPNDYTTPRKLLFGQLAQDKDIEDLLTLAYLNKRAVGQGSGVVLMFLGLSWGIMFALSPTGIIGIVFGLVVSVGAIALGYYSYRKSTGI